MHQHALHKEAPANASVEAALQPRLKKALKVLQDPDMFWEGCGDF